MEADRLRVLEKRLAMARARVVRARYKQWKKTEEVRRIAESIKKCGTDGEEVWFLDEEGADAIVKELEKAQAHKARRERQKDRQKVKAEAAAAIAEYDELIQKAWRYAARRYMGRV